MVSKTRLALPEPDEDGQLALRDIDADITQVVIPRAGGPDEFLLWHEA